MYEKQNVSTFLEAIKEAGFTKLGFIGAAIIFWILGMNTFFIAALAIAIYVNANTVWKYLLKGVDLGWLNLKNFI